MKENTVFPACYKGNICLYVGAAHACVQKEVLRSSFIVQSQSF